MNRNRLSMSLCGARAASPPSWSRARCRPRRRRRQRRPTSSACRIRSTRRAAISRGCAAATPIWRARLQTELDDLRDEVVYLKVKLRKEGNVSRSDYTDVQDRLQDLRSRARGDGARRQHGGWRDDTATVHRRANGDCPPAACAAAASAGGDSQRRSLANRTGHRRTARSTSAIPAGQEIDVRLESELSSDDGAGRAALRSDDRRRSVSRQRRADSRGSMRARRRQLRQRRRRGRSARAA